VRTLATRRAGRVAVVWLLVATSAIALSGCTALSFAVANVPARLAGLQRTANIPYGELPRQRLDVYRPARADVSRPVVVFWYGGAWTEGARAQYRFVGAALAQRGYVVVVPDYRLYPEVRFPTFLDDGARAVYWVQQHIAEFGGNAQRIVLMGHSAGAYMASMLLADAQYLRRARADSDRIVGLIALSGPFNLTPDTPSLNAIFASPYSVADWRVTAQQKRAAPPTLLIHGLDDRLVQSAVSERFATQLRSLGSDVTLKLYARCDHVCPLAALSVPARRRATSLADITVFLNSLSVGPQE
jgi:acetyl esterase/lipase